MVRNDDFLRKGLSLLPEVKKIIRKPLSEKYKAKPLAEGDALELDFGRHLTGYLHLRFGYRNAHPDAPVWLRISFAERKREFQEKAEDYHGWICRGWVQQEQVHVDVIPGELSLPRRYAFRYVRIEVLAISSKFLLTVEDASAEAVSSAEDEKLTPYISADQELERLDRIAVSTLHECMQRVFEDGPKRDRRMWMGDLRLEALTNYETYHNTEMVKGCLYLFAALPRENGAVASNLFLEPEPESDDTVMFDYSLLFIVTLYEYFEAAGDRETLKELWPLARKQITLAYERVADGVVSDDDRIGWCFLDWNLELNKQAGANGVLLYALTDAINIATVLGDTAEEAHLKGLYQDLKEQSFRKFYDKEKGLFVSGADHQISYASQIWLILGGAVSPELGRDILKRVKECPDAVKMVTPYMYHYYIEALCHCGEQEEALNVLKNYWGGMADQGADTFWELYDPTDPDASPYGGTIVNSYCHAWSTAPAYFLRKWCEEKQ